MSTATVPARAPGSTPKLVVFIVFALLTIFVTVAKNARIFDSTSEIAQHFAPVKGYLAVHACFGMLALALGAFQFSNRLRARYLKTHRMLGYVYVVDSPYYGQADGAGAFTIRGVPPGEYDLEIWHEASSKNTRQRLIVGAAGVRNLAVRIGGDRRPPAFVPDKSGKARQSHIGY